MNDELFSDLPEGEPSELDKARARFAEAQAAWVAAQEALDEWGDPIPRDVAEGYRAASRALTVAEEAELKRRM